MTLGLFNGTGSRHGDATLAGVKGVWVSRKMWWRYFTSEVTSGQQRARITGYGAYLPKWVFVAGQGARANWNERRTDAPAKAFEQEVQFRSNHLNAERSDFFERLSACPDLMVLLCDGNGRFWMVGEDAGLRTSWTGKTENVQGYEITITGQQRFPTREVAGDAAQLMIQSDPTSVSPEAAAILDPEDLAYLGLDDSGCIVLGQNPVTICCGSGGGISEEEVQTLIDNALATLTASDISFTPTGSLTATNVQSAIAQLEQGVVNSLMPIATNIARLDGINDYFTWNTAGAALPDEMTFTCWVKADTIVNNRALFTTNYLNSGTDTINFTIGIGSTGPQIARRVASTGAVVLNYAVPLEGNQFSPLLIGQWVHVAFRLRRIATTYADVWVNGQLYAFGSAFALPPTNYGTTAGFGNNVSDNFFRGCFSNFTLHSRLLTRDEMLSLARRGRAFSVPASGLIAHWPFESVTGTSPDISGNGNTLTAVNGPLQETMN